MADQRLDLISETLNGIKIIKMFCWENSFKKMVDRFRKLFFVNNTIIEILN